MKLLEASAVFLIIGGALLGPIEAKCTIGNVFGAAQCRGWETFAETCKRVIQEIGAVQSGDNWYLKSVPAKVICILAPSGLGGRHEPQ